MKVNKEKLENSIEKSEFHDNDESRELSSSIFENELDNLTLVSTE